MNQHIGSSFDHFLEEENSLSVVSAEALTRVLVWQIKNYLELNQLNKKMLAAGINKSRSPLDRNTLKH